MTARLISGLALALAVAASALPTPAAALDDDGKGSVLGSVKGLLNFGFGLETQEPEAEIDYRQRAPLVLPPRSGLPQPRAQTEKLAAWPQDPDVVRRREAAERAKTPRGLYKRDELSKRELMSGRVATNPARPGQDPEKFGCRGTGDGCIWLHPDVLRSTGVKKDEPAVVVGQEPSRDWLTEPPKGYRRATQQTGVGVVRPQVDNDTSHPLSFILKPFRKDEDE